MFLLFTTDQREVNRLAAAAAAFPGEQVSDGHDACLAGTPDQIRERLHQARAAGVDTLFIPTVLRPLPEIQSVVRFTATPD